MNHPVAIHHVVYGPEEGSLITTKISTRALIAGPLRSN